MSEWDNQVKKLLKEQRTKYLQSENDGKIKILKKEAIKIIESGQLTIIKEYIEDINNPNIKKEMSENFNKIENEIANINNIEDDKVVETFKQLGHDLVTMKGDFQGKMTTLKKAMEEERKDEEKMMKAYNNLTL